MSQQIIAATAELYKSSAISEGNGYVLPHFKASCMEASKNNARISE